MHYLNNYIQFINIKSTLISAFALVTTATSDASIHSDSRFPICHQYVNSPNWDMNMVDHVLLRMLMAIMMNIALIFNMKIKLVNITKKLTMVFIMNLKNLTSIPHPQNTLLILKITMNINQRWNINPMSNKFYFQSTKSPTLIQCISIACAPGQTWQYTERAIHQRYALEQ